MNKKFTHEEVEILFISALKHYLKEPTEKASEICELFYELSPHLKENTLLLARKELEDAFDEYESSTLNLVGHHSSFIPVFGTEYNRKSWQSMLNKLLDLLEKKE